MLVDSHCHLDFPELAEDRAGVLARARAAGVGRMVTISTRVRKHAQVLAVAERFADVFCSVGTHPHNAHEELDIGTAELLARDHRVVHAPPRAYAADASRARRLRQAAVVVADHGDLPWVLSNAATHIGRRSRPSRTRLRRDSVGVS